MKLDDPRHGTRAGYVAGCRGCQPCLDAHRTYQKRSALRRLREGSQYVPRADLAPLLEHWLNHGLTLNGIADAAGLAGTTLSEDRFPTIERSTFRVVAAITWADVPDTALVYGDLTRRRIYSLAAAGHKVTTTCHETEMDLNGAWRKSTRIHAGLARRIQTYYAELSTTDGPSSRAAARATGAGNQRPAAWDDPGTPAVPLGWEPETADPLPVDPVVVERIVAGDFSLARAATKPERIEVVDRWRSAGLPLNELERRTGWEPRRYTTTPALDRGAA